MSSVGLDLPSGKLDDGDAAALLACHTRVLTLMSSNASRQTLLDEITSDLEQLIPTGLVSLLLVEAAGTLRHASAPTLPASYLAAIDGLEPGPRQGACGTAAYLAEVVIVEDITLDDRWDGYQHVAAAARCGRAGRLRCSDVPAGWPERWPSTTTTSTSRRLGN